MKSDEKFKKYNSATAENKKWSEAAKDKCPKPEYVSRQNTKQKLQKEHFRVFFHSVL